MTCPFFNHTVVLLVEHGEDGALGFVVNRPTDTPVTSLLDGDEDEDFGSKLEGEVWIGGPVAPDTGWVLFDPSSGGEDDEIECVELGERVAVSASRTFLDLLAEGRGPTRYALLLGYAGWGPGQLEEELERGSWLLADASAALVFDTPLEDRYQQALALLGLTPHTVWMDPISE